MNRTLPYTIYQLTIYHIFQKWAFALLLCFPILLHAQERRVQVIVVDNDSREPLPGATVALYAPASDSLLSGGFTDENGRVVFTSFPANAAIRVGYAGYESQTIQLSDQQTQEVLVQMMPLTQEDVVITAGRYKQNLAEVPVSMSVISQDQIDMQASSTIEDVLQQSSGIDIKDGQVSIRGSSGYAFGVGSRVMLLYNGLPLLNPDAGIAQLDLIPTDRVGRVEVMKGASSVLYGSSALGGVINIIPADIPDSAQTGIRLRQTLFDAPANPLLDWDGSSGAGISSVHAWHARKIGNLGIMAQGDLIRDTGYKMGTKTNRYRGFVSLEYNVPNASGIRFGLNASMMADSGGSYLYWKSYFPDTSVATTGDTMVSGGGLTPAKGTLRKEFRTKTAIDPWFTWLTPKGYLHQYRSRIYFGQNRTTTQSNIYSNMFYNDYQLKKDIKDNHTVVGGVTATYNTVTGDSIFGGDHFSWNGAVYGQWDAKFGRLRTTVGGRYEYFSIDGKYTEQSPVFRAGLNVELWKGANYRMSFGQAFRSPSIAERYTSTAGGSVLIQPNPDLIVEKGYSMEAGLRQGFKIGADDKRQIKGFADVAVFRMHYENMIEFGINGLDITTFTPTFSAVNISEASITGVEITALAAWQLRKFHGSLSGGFTWINPVNENASPEDSLVNLDPVDQTPLELGQQLLGYIDGTLKDNPATLKYRSKELARGSLSVGYGPLTLTTNVRYRSRVEEIDEFLNFAIADLAEFRRAHTGGVSIVDLVLAWGKRRWEVAVAVDNAFQAEYLIIPGILGPQRSMTLQVKMRF